MHQSVEASEALGQLGRSHFDLLWVGDVELDDLADLADLGEFSRGALGEGKSPSGTGEGDGRSFFQGTLGDAERQRVIGEDAGDENTVVGK